MQIVQKNILIVDDEEDITWAISRSLTNSPYDLKIKCANDGDQAYELIKKETFDLVISDVRMPGRNGYELASSIREKHPTVKVIIMSAYQNQSEAYAQEVGGDFLFIEKPFDVQNLRDMVIATLKNEPNGTQVSTLA